jgi:hypothetical protein
MRQLQTQEIQNVSGAGLLTNVVKATASTAVAAGTAAGTGLVAAGTGLAQAGVIVAKPVVTGAVKTFKWLI